MANFEHHQAKTAWLTRWQWDADVDYRLALAAGTVLAGEYRIAGTLRQDGFCITYDAEDLQLKKHVLIKEYCPAEIADRVRLSTIRPKSTRDVGALSWGRQRFIEEARTLTKFSHPGIARLKRVFEDNNTAYAVVEADDWPTLLAWVAKLQRPPSQLEIDRILAEALDALAVLHAANVLVRDLSPDSIFMRGEDRLVLVDFGSAKFKFAAHARKMHIVVRPGYSAPEQYLADDTQHGQWTDIFSLASVLYRLVTGRSPIDVIHRHRVDDMPKAAAAAAAPYRARLLAAIDQAMQVAIEARPQSIEAWRTMLAPAPGVTAAAFVTPPVPAADPSPALVAPAPPTAPTPSKPAPAAPAPPATDTHSTPHAARDLHAVDAGSPTASLAGAQDDRAIARRAAPGPAPEPTRHALAVPEPLDQPSAASNGRLRMLAASLVLGLIAFIGIGYAALPRTNWQQLPAAKSNLADFIRSKEQDKASADQKRYTQSGEQRSPIPHEKRATDEARLAESIDTQRKEEVRRIAEQQHLGAENERMRREVEVLRTAEERRRGAEAESARLEDARRASDQQRLAADAELRRYQEPARGSEERRAAELKRQAEEAARIAEEQRMSAEQRLANQISGETNPDALQRIAMQNPAQRALVARRFNDLAFIRIATPTGEIWRRPGGGDTFSDCTACPRMVALPAGQLLMGSPAGEAGRQENEDDAPGPGGAQVLVTIAKPFAVSHFEITRSQFADFIAETLHPMQGGCMVRVDAFELLPELSWRDPGFPQDNHHPVACVSWRDAQAYITWLSNKTGRPYRLLTEAEWEYAARGTSKPEPQSRLPFGVAEAALCAHANAADRAAKRTYPHWLVAPCDDGYDHTAPVGTFKANAVGLHDMLGNLWEWTADCYHDSYKGQPVATRASGAAWLTDCDPAMRVLRGGSWSDPPGSLRPAARIVMPSGRRMQIGGFRVARELEP